jgi:hypothetical protein
LPCARLSSPRSDDAPPCLSFPPYLPRSPTHTT